MVGGKGKDGGDVSRIPQPTHGQDTVGEDWEVGDESEPAQDQDTGGECTEVSGDSEPEPSKPPK